MMTGVNTLFCLPCQYIFMAFPLKSITGIKNYSGGEAKIAGTKFSYRAGQFQWPEELESINFAISNPQYALTELTAPLALRNMQPCA